MLDSVYGAKNQRSIRSAEAEGIRQRGVQLRGPRLSDEIEVAGRIDFVDVEVCRKQLVLEGEDADGGLDRSGSAEKMAMFFTCSPAHWEIAFASAMSLSGVPVPCELM
jgi:hypothetical protein